MSRRNVKASRRAFGEISKLAGGRYRARLRLPGGERVSAPMTFVARMDAEGWLVHQERDLSRGEWQPPTKAAAPTTRSPATSTKTSTATHWKWRGVSAALACVMRMRLRGSAG